MSRKKNGFSLLEFSIIIFIIMLLVVIWISLAPLLKSEAQKAEKEAIWNCRAIGNAENSFSATRNHVMYADLEMLVGEGILDKRFLNPDGFDGYVYQFSLSWYKGIPSVPPDMLTSMFEITATPAPGSPARYGYTISTDNVVRYGNPAPAGHSPGEAVK